jgi:hypothetical protein
MSVTFMQKSLMPDWMQTVADYNPLNWAVEAGREAVTANPDWGVGRRQVRPPRRLPDPLRDVRPAGLPHLPALGLAGGFDPAANSLFLRPDQPAQDSELGVAVGPSQFSQILLELRIAERVGH